MDTGGVKACKQFYDEANASYVTLVDSQNAFAEVYDFKVIPNGFFYDEAGKLVYMKIGGFEVRRPETIKTVEEFLARPPVKPGLPVESQDYEQMIQDIGMDLKHNPNNAELHLDLGKVYMQMEQPEKARPYLKTAAIKLPESETAQFSYAACLLALGEKAEAVSFYKKALKLDPSNYVIRKQIWMIEHPEKFHPEIDWGWQREQLAKEKAEEEKAKE